MSDVKNVASPDDDSSRRGRPISEFLLLLALSFLLIVGHRCATTTDRPINIPQVHLSKSEIHDIKHRWNEFHHDLHHGKTPKHDLEITEKELNGFWCDDDDTRCGQQYATISENTISTDFCFPAANFLPGGKDRYLVGSGIQKVVPDKENDSAYFVQNMLTVFGNQEKFTVVNVTGTVDLSGSLDVELKSAEVFGWMATRFFEGTNWVDYTMFPKGLHGHIKGVSIGSGKIVFHVN